MAVVTAVRLAVADVTKTYRRGPELIRAVDGVSLGFPAGAVSLLTGPSGSGKTTLLNLLAGWEAPDRGAVLWDGSVRRTPPAWSDLAIVPQRLGLLAELTVAENVGLADRIAGRPHDHAGLLAALGLGELAAAFPEELSVGQQQRAAIARALAAGAGAVLADEPTSSQDEANAHVVLGALRAAATAGAAVVVASHDPISPDYADAVAVMEDGRVV